MPDRLPSLVVLVAFWVPPALAGGAAASKLRRNNRQDRANPPYLALSTVVLGYALAWFFLHVGRMPPYVPGATIDPTYAAPEAVRWLATFTGLVILPGSALAAALTYRLGLSARGREPALGDR